MIKISWVGSEQHYIDQPHIQQLGELQLARFGGSAAAGQTKNEDGCIIWANDDWEIVMILDAHQTAESAELIVSMFVEYEQELTAIMSGKAVNSLFQKLEKAIMTLFMNEVFREKCRKVQGETSCLISVRKGQFLWWFSVGDCMLFLLHDDLKKLGQFQLNQRQFFEWVGRVNTFDKVVPCYTTGRRELRKGTNTIFITTDGLIECPEAGYHNPEKLYEVFKRDPAPLEKLLNDSQRLKVRDSVTMVSWSVDVRKEGSMPSGS
ncbi:protein phosphatase 2C domain-containing protein [Jeotgalibacillus sp. R-1-5s-1]|uniref:protein phosphatase 2C domain-containing protein n=1 Tax=Jeotgalibacillus sp. R-1-5s-1 TaxID=2555897 RepID=UPI00106DB623|nr:protein phosphatase 2C domain-containing protein [Jeotgalibacillus sp. R-1-5s-1]TFD99892.1 protein phosphatase 2C domain-containing protein [Jeotgalibacillus sp. R-1-5s-1]